MPKEILQIIISKRKTSKYKLIRWFQYQWFIIWGIWRPKIVSKVCGFMADIILKILPQEERDKLLKEFDEIEVHIIDDTK